MRKATGVVCMCSPVTAEFESSVTWKCLPRLLADKEGGAADSLTRPVLPKPCKETAGPRMQSGSSVDDKTVTVGTF